LANTPSSFIIEENHLFTSKRKPKMAAFSCCFLFCPLRSSSRQYHHAQLRKSAFIPFSTSIDLYRLLIFCFCDA